MVKSSILFLALASAFSAALAAPYFGQQRFTNFDPSDGEKCLPETDVYEYQPFMLKNTFLNTFVSKIDHDNMLVGDLPGDKNFHALQFCIVLTDEECYSRIMKRCIVENAEYRIRVFSPEKGYLHADDDVVTIRSDFKEASAFTLYMGRDGGLRISQMSSNGDRVVLASLEPTAAYIWQEPTIGDDHEWFELIRP
ncbi:hypothetical protein BGZ93_009891 [Podila epicladia]|nr:hypothetical protein BGZ92_002107 [Podila epicladia]KAG0098918.1 hypothetical protein BGZ93_009891 [Podila epicladia]